MILEQDSLDLYNMPLRVKKLIHYINMFDSDYIMICSTAIPSFRNTLKNIYPGGTLLGEFAYMYYNDKNDAFRLLFRQYTSSAVENIYHPCIVK